MPRQRLNLVNEVYGRLTVDEYAGNIGKVHYWYCTCECGSETLVSTTNLRNGHAKSCGCLNKEAVSQRRLKHGARRLQGGKRVKSPEWDAYYSMLREEHVVPEWNDFREFFKDVGWRPGDTYELSRRDRTQPHGPNNTYWRDPNEEREERRSRSIADEFCLDMSCIGDTYSCTTAPDQARERQAAGVH